MVGRNKKILPQFSFIGFARTKDKNSKGSLGYGFFRICNPTASQGFTDKNEKENIEESRFEKFNILSWIFVAL